MVEFGVQIPMAPLSGTSFTSLSKSNGFLGINSRFPEFNRTVLGVMPRIVRFALSLAVSHFSGRVCEGLNALVSSSHAVLLPFGGGLGDGAV